MHELVMYLFGERNPEIAAVLRERSFQSLVGGLFAAGEPVLPRERPPVWSDAVRLDLLASSGEEGYRAGRRLVLIPAAAERGGAALLGPALDRYVEIAASAQDELCAAYEQTAAAERFAWPQVSHAVVAGLFLDLAMGREIDRAGTIARPAAGDAVIWAFQGVSAGNAFGVSAVPAGPGRRLFFAELWHRRARPAAVPLRPALVEELGRIARGEEAGSARDLLVLKHLRLVRAAGGPPRLQIPFFGTADTALLRPLLERGARRLVAEAVLPALGLLERHPWWQEGLRSAALRHAAVRLVLEHGIDRAIAAGVCAPFPGDRAVPVEWGRWLWEDEDGDLVP
jgi:hypothetical protein